MKFEFSHSNNRYGNTDYYSAYLTNIRNLRDNDHIEEPYVLTREEELILSIESAKTYISKLEKNILEYRSIIAFKKFPEDHFNKEVKALERSIRKKRQRNNRSRKRIKS